MQELRQLPKEPLLPSPEPGIGPQYYPSSRMPPFARHTAATLTNASTILREDYRDTKDLDGVFSGWDGEKKQYSPETWPYEGSEQKRHPSQPAPGHHPADGGHVTEIVKLLPAELAAHAILIIEADADTLPGSEAALRCIGRSSASCILA